MIRGTGRTILAAWLLAVATFAAVFLFVAHRPQAVPQQIVRLCEVVALPESKRRFECEAPGSRDAVAQLVRWKFDQGLAGFALVDQDARRAEVTAPSNRTWAPQPLGATNGEPAAVRFPDARGGLAIVTKSAPGRLLAITARVRRGKSLHPIVDEAVERMQGVLFAQPLQREVDLARALETRDLVALLADPMLRIGLDSRVVSRTAAADGEWTTLIVALQTPPLTTALALQIGAGTGATGAPFDVAEIAIEEMTLRRFAAIGGLPDDAVLVTLATPPPTSNLPLLPPDDPAIPWLRPVEDLLERRDAIVLPPPARATFEADVPAGDLVLEYGIARVHETRVAWAKERIDVRVEVRALNGGTTRSQSTLLDAGGPDGWQDRRLLLAPLGGGRLRFTFSTTSSTGATHDVVAIGAPIVRRRSSGDPRRSIVLVSLDTVRADHLSCEGYPRPTTPRLDALAHESAWFRDAASTSSYTLPAHGSLMSGQLPSRHGAESEAAGRGRLWLDRSDLLASRLHDAGWQTAAFTGGVYLGAKFGFAQGFDRYDSTDLALERRAPRFEREPVSGQPAFNRAYRRQRGWGHALDWIRGHADGPFFLFLHTYLVHEYLPAPRHEARFHGSCASAVADEDQRFLRDRTLVQKPLAADVDHFVDLYDGALHEADELVGRLLDTLRDTGELEQTIVVVVSDHGEEFLEHGGLSHGRTLYDEMLRVPLIVRYPGAAPVEIHEPVSLVDVAPTLLEWSGLVPIHDVDGRSLAALIAGASVAAANAPAQLAELNLVAANRWIARRQHGFAALDLRDERGAKALARDQATQTPPRRMLFGGTRDPYQSIDLRGSDPSTEAIELQDALSEQRAEMRKRRKGAQRFDSNLQKEGYLEVEEEEEGEEKK